MVGRGCREFRRSGHDAIDVEALIVFVAVVRVRGPAFSVAFTEIANLEPRGVAIDVPERF